MDAVRRQDRIPGWAGQVDDRTTVAKPTRRLPVDDQCGPSVDSAQRIELFEVDLSYCGGGDPADDGMHDDIDAAERLGRLREEALHVQIVSDVAADGHGGATGGENRIDGRLRQPLVVQIVDDDGVAAGRQPADCRPTHAA